MGGVLIQTEQHSGPTKYIDSYKTEQHSGPTKYIDSYKTVEYKNIKTILDVFNVVVKQIVLPEVWALIYKKNGFV